jgi:undecaprenyl phosphate N,N'-diacetylbacillosamine 1-phosphate transferase
MKRTTFYSENIKPLLAYLVALLVLLITGPILLLTAILIVLDSKGPVFFKQARLGLNGSVFMLYKFRSMTHEPSRLFNKQTVAGDPDVTRIGAIIRRLKIDELPQVINVLRGEMAIVGPRPSLPNLQEKFDDNGRSRILVKPGLTGLAAVNGSIFLTWPQRWVFDRYYVENLSWWLDFKIVMRTVVVLIMGERYFYKPN